MEKEIDFANPPVVEVVCGVAFSSLRALQMPHFGIFWNSFRNEFPRVQEAPPLPPPSAGEIEIEFSQIPPLPRVWYLSEDETALIQLQKDRLTYNWKRQEPTDPYPRYGTIFPEFMNWVSKFGEFVRENDLGELQFRQFELTYLNHIPMASLDGVLARASDTLLDHKRDGKQDRFLPEPTNFSWKTEYALPNDTGRFFVAAQSARTIADGSPLIRIDISAKGIGENASTSGMTSWFDIAHEWIIRGFVDVTDERVQSEVWGKR